MKILGISCYYHDAAAVLIDDGRIVAAAEEERFSRRKHDSSFPRQAIDFCMKQHGISASDIDYAVFYEKPFKKFHRIMLSALSTYPRSYTSFTEAIRIWLTQKLWIKQDIISRLDIPNEKILFSNHHLSHAASSFYPSPFEKAAILTVDGVGEWTTAAYGIGENNNIRLLKEIRFPQSLGLLYSAFTAFLGFEVNEGEWKVMGLAPFGNPTYTDKVWKTVKLNTDGSFSLDLSYFSYLFSDSKSFSGKFVSLFGKPVHPSESHIVTQKSADIAASIQKVTEEILLHMAKTVRNETGMENLCLAGGVGLNSVANYRLLKESGFKNIFIQPAAGDSGGALGAALYVYHHLLKNEKRTVWNHSYHGASYENDYIKSYLTKEKIPHVFMNDKQLTDTISRQITRGKVIGWIQGRFEWGPRALGNRSILGDPRNPNMKDIINVKVKFRERFRPFAPSVLSERAHLAFSLPENSPDHLPLRYMLYVIPVKPVWRKKIPAITHADNTARVQLVDKETNPFYHALIRSFYEKTGVPMLLNTSFNLKGEPIVNSPADAYSTFNRSGIDTLVMGNYVCEKG